jgi:hypothetical protein
MVKSKHQKGIIAKLIFQLWLPKLEERRGVKERPDL